MCVWRKCRGPVPNTTDFKRRTKKTKGNGHLNSEGVYVHIQSLCHKRREEKRKEKKSD